MSNSIADAPILLIIMPIINNIVLLLTAAESDIINVKTAAAPIIAPETTAPAAIVPVIIVTTAAPTDAPVEIPKIEGPANGLPSVVCNINPAAESAAPAKIAVRHCGMRMSKRILAVTGFASGFLITDHNSLSGMSTEPLTSETIINANNVKINMIAVFRIIVIVGKIVECNP